MPLASARISAAARWRPARSLRDLDRGDHLAHRLALEGEEAPLGDDAGELPPVADQEVPDPVPRHDERGLVQRRARRQVNGVRRHVRADRPLERHRARGRKADEVALGEDASRSALCIDDHDGADVLTLHDFERAPERRVGKTRDRCTAGSPTRAVAGAAGRLRLARRRRSVTPAAPAVAGCRCAACRNAGTAGSSRAASARRRHRARSRRDPRPPRRAAWWGGRLRRR